jgi:hypothetical protein
METYLLQLLISIQPLNKNQKQEWPVAAMFVNGAGQNEQSL